MEFVHNAGAATIILKLPALIFALLNKDIQHKSATQQVLPPVLQVTTQKLFYKSYGKRIPVKLSFTGTNGCYNNKYKN